MKMIDSGTGCPMCRRIPSLSSEEVQQLQNGEFLHGLVEQAHNTANHSEKNATDSMNDVLDNLEALFGFGSASAQGQNGSENVTEEDLGVDHIIYRHNAALYLRGKRRDYAIRFCPFCGNALSK